MTSQEGIRGQPLRVVTSWDDGHPLDLRLAERLARHGVAGTFFCPLRNAEGLPVMDAAALRSLQAAGFEIGSHTHDHVYASRVPPASWATQVRLGKEALEAALGVAVPGFCYPGGEYDDNATAAVQACGFAYARTTDNFHLDPGGDPWRVPTTLQCFGHSRPVLFGNLVRRGHWCQRAATATVVLRADGLSARLDALLEHALARGGVLHLWGHSWELEQHGLWPQLEAFLATVAAAVPPHRRLTLRELMAQPSPTSQQGPA